MCGASPLREKGRSLDVGAREPHGYFGASDATSARAGVVTVQAPEQAVAHHAARQVAADHPADTSEHLALGHAVASADHLPDALGEVPRSTSCQNPNRGARRFATPRSRGRAPSRTVTATPRGVSIGEGSARKSCATPPRPREQPIAWHGSARALLRDASTSAHEPEDHVVSMLGLLFAAKLDLIRHASHRDSDGATRGEFPSMLLSLTNETALILL